MGIKSLITILNVKVLKTVRYKFYKFFLVFSMKVFQINELQNVLGIPNFKKLKKPFLRSFVNARQWPYSQHSIFFVTYESAQYARLLHNSRLKRLTSDKHSNLLGQFLSYEENVVLWILTQGHSKKLSYKFLRSLSRHGCLNYKNIA